VQQIYPGPADGTEVSTGGLARLYAYPAPRGRPWVRANMVSSVDGAATLDGLSGGLGGAADRSVFAVLRGLTDVVLVGAGTARAENYRPARPGAAAEIWPELRAGRPATPPIAVVTRRLTLDLSAPLIAEAPAHARTIIITTAAAPAERRAAAAAVANGVVAGEDTVDLHAAVDALAARGHQRVLAEGGPRLLGQLAGAGLLDELCLTVSPVLAGGSGGRILDAAGPAAAGPELAGAEPGGGPASPGSLGRLTLRHVLVADGSLLCRYQRAS
jgi:riboflavin biosynthesis pyrimidine reductase